MCPAPKSELEMVLVEKRWQRIRKGIKRPTEAKVKEILRAANRGRAGNGGREKVAC